MSNNNYSQLANPNSTQDEFYGKVIIKHSGLTSEQRDELIESFVEIQVDNMDTKTLVEWVTDLLVNDYDKLTDSELKERVDCYDDELYDELVDNVNFTNSDAKYQHLQEIKYDREVN